MFIVRLLIGIVPILFIVAAVINLGGPGSGEFIGKLLGGIILPLIFIRILWSLKKYLSISGTAVLSVLMLFFIYAAYSYFLQKAGEFIGGSIGVNYDIDRAKNEISQNIDTLTSSKQKLIHITNNARLPANDLSEVTALNNKIDSELEYLKHYKSKINNADMRNYIKKNMKIINDKAKAIKYDVDVLFLKHKSQLSS